ncbi:LacI family DNA-binding transcriptional regulator [Mesorhizobium sp.]|uniref:LacI family DNA-binding transcriptional regulator n=1 Tax=Mesorhizobium sp. TaxID=1871066 RepID=UPI000FEA3B22|nr:LacI family DNA-binding transcriptional regulator [Mesorhizobium sp.]RWM77836.1 MAG: LacI family DNA-binding transcriptional regulator [Mesorhizobium sp.]TIL70465.1 MAG: LacI family DNA-binding transcriptional regulator [Mesorhizobium sp.]
MMEDRPIRIARGKRVTIADLAREAGVSVATVDRVLNVRLPVREETAQRVHAAAHAIGYHAAGLIKQRLQQHLPHYKLGFILRKPTHDFYQDFARKIEESVSMAKSFHGLPIIEFAQSHLPRDLLPLLKDLGSRCQAIAMVAADHPKITASVEELKAKGIPVFSLLSDFADGVREGYIGLNNSKVGRTAAWVFSKAAKRPGKVAVFVGSHRFQAHATRETAFRAYFRENAPKFEVLDALVNLDERQLTYEKLLDLMQREPELVGFYMAGGGIEGAISALREEGSGQDFVAIVSEMTPQSRGALADDILTMAVGTPMRRLCQELIMAMERAIKAGVAESPGQTFLPFDIYLPENI